MAFHHRSRGPVIAAAAIIAIVIIGVAAAVAGMVPTVSSSATITLQKGHASTFYLPDTGSASSVYLSSATGSGAVLYVGHDPVLSSPITVAVLSSGQSVNVSTTKASYANLQIRLVSSTAGAATITLTYVPSSLGIATSYGLSTLNGSVPQQSTLATSTVQTTSTAATTQTTTVRATNLTQAALELANATSYGVLINQYKVLYERDAAACTRAQYDIAYSQAFGSVPSGPNTFANVSMAVPTTIRSSITKVSGDLYNITYSSVSGIGVSPALAIRFNSTGQYVVTSKFVGIFVGQTYATAMSCYQSLNVSNTCLTYLP